MGRETPNTDGLQPVIDQSSEGIAITDEEGRVVIWNRKLSEMTGLAPDDVRGVPLWDVQFSLVPENRQTDKLKTRLETSLRSYLEDGENPSAGLDQTLRLPDGTVRYQSGSISSIRTGKGHIILAITRDVTEQHETSKALAAFSAQQQMLATVGALAVEAGSVDELFDEALRLACKALRVELAAVLCPEPGAKALRLMAGSGWPDGCVGTVVFDAGPGTVGGAALEADGALVVSDFANEDRFTFPEMLVELGVASGMCVALGEPNNQSSLLTVCAKVPREFSSDEINFLLSLGHILSGAEHRISIDTRLKESEALFRRMYESASVGISRVSLDDDFIDVNEAFCRLLGYSHEELVGTSIWDIHSPELVSSSRTLQDDLRSGRIDTMQVEKKYLTKTGEVVWVLLDSRLIRDEGGEPSYFLGNVVDISERKKAAAELQKLTVGVDQSPVSIVITDTSGNIEYVNSRFCEVSGYTVEQAIGRNPRILKSGEQPDDLYRELWTTITDGRTWKGEFHNRRSDGSLYWEEATIGPITNDDGVIINFIAFKEDITEKKDLELQLLQSQRLDAIGKLAGGIAHDFNNLLTVINGYGTLAMDRVEKDSPIRSDLEQIIAAGGRAGTLTQQLLAFSRKQVIRPAVLNLNSIVTDMTAMLRRLVGENIRVETRLADNLTACRVDPGQMNQIIMNLAVNARDAMPDGGSILIETQNFRMGEGYSSQHMGAPPGDYCELAVSDDGSGMDGETLARAFEPFFTTKVVGKGTGLGLSTVYGIVKQHNGYVWLYSEPGVGTTVKVYVPSVEDELSPLKEAETIAVRTDGTETILLVEDDETVRGLTAGILKQAGYTVLAAPDGRRALSTYSEHSDDIELVISDVVMPGMGGKELVDKIRERSPGIPVIFVSGYTDEAVSLTGLLANEAELLSKPFHPVVLLARVRSVLDQSDGD